MCFICGQPETVRCSCQVTQPFCDQCGDDINCAEKINAECVFFHFNCVNQGGLPNLGINCNTDLDTILHILDDLVGNSLNIPFEGQESNSIAWVPNGPAGHKPQANVKISADPGNITEIRDDGIFTPETDIPEPVPPVFTTPVTNDCISLNTSIDEETGEITITPSLNILCLINKIRDEHLEEFCALIDDCQCLLNIENLVAVFGAACPPGYILNEISMICELDEVEAATVEETLVEACESQYTQYAMLGSLIYTGGFNANGEGVSGHVLNGLGTDIANGDVVLMTNNGVWRNNTLTENNYGPINRAGVWRCAGSGGSFGFVVPVNVPTNGTYYFGIGADNFFQITVNGVTVVDTTPLTGNDIYWNSGPNSAFYRYWHIYPVALTAGINYIGFVGVDTGGVESVLAAEIYNNTLAELQAAVLEPAFLADPALFPVDQSHYTNLNLIFSTRCARQPGTVFTLGNATCPDNTWDLDTTGGDPLVSPCQGINSDPGDWLCRRTIYSAFAGYTVTLVWDRIPTAINYTVEQKPNGDPDVNYVAAAGSPVVNPGSGTTVNLVVSSLPSDQYTFRVRANFENCSSEWVTIVAEEPECVDVSFTLGAELLAATEEESYFMEIPLSGSGPFTLSGITKPSWMSIQIVGSILVISGTPPAASEASNVPVAFTVENCAEGSQAYAGTIDILAAGDFAEMMRFGNDDEVICGEAESVVYFTGPFTPTTTILYSDAAQTTPVVGFNFVGRTNDSIIYNLNSVTGLVGTTTGNAC